MEVLRRLESVLDGRMDGFPLGTVRYGTAQLGVLAAGWMELVMSQFSQPSHFFLTGNIRAYLKQRSVGGARGITKNKLGKSKLSGVAAARFR